MNNDKILEVQKTYGVKLAQTALKFGAIKLSPKEPFTWASGYRMPIYNDNRRFLALPEMRLCIAEAFAKLMDAVEFKPQWLAGTATAGIPHSVTLGDLLKLPVSYVRSSGKGHGLKNQIEGLGQNADYKNETVLVIEDLISTGGSSIKAIEAVREANGQVPYCFAIFSYGLEKSAKAFAEMSPACTSITILNYDIMLEEALKQNYINEEEKLSLAEWKNAPFEWGENHGFKKQT